MPENQIALAAMTQGLSGSDLTSLLLEVFARRGRELSAADLMRQYRRDRFVAPATVDALALSRLQLSALEIAASDFAPVALAPVAPLGTHLALGSVPQNNVVSTARLSEVTADPTNSLALEAAARRVEIVRSDPRSAHVVQLAATHRVVRAQHFEGPRSFAHFALLGLVSAGRDQGNYGFEQRAMTAQLRTLIRIVRAVSEAEIEVRLTALQGAFDPVCDSIIEDLRQAEGCAGVQFARWPERQHGRDYYRNICFKLTLAIGDDVFELGDGGDVWWTQNLLQSRKERLIIGGLGLERLAMLLADYGDSTLESPSEV